MRNAENKVSFESFKRIEKLTLLMLILWTGVNISIAGWGISHRMGFTLTWGWMDMGIYVIPWLLGVVGTMLANRQFKRMMAAQESFTASLQQSHQHLQALVDYSPDAILIYQDETLVFVNKTAVKMLKAQNADEMTGTGILAFVEPKSHAAFLARLEEIDQKQQTLPPLIQQMVQMDGSRLDVYMTVSKIQFSGRAAFQVMASDITYQQQLERAIKNIEKSVSVSIGQKFFDTAVTQLCNTLEADYAFVGHLVPSQDGIEMLAFCEGSQMLTPKTYPLENTPCMMVVNHKFRCYPTRVAELFPANTFLKANGIEGYVGMPLWNSDGTARGLIAALYRKPVQKVEFAKDLLQIFGGQVQIELERNRTLTELKKNEALLETVFNAIPFEIWVADAEGACVLQNPVSRQYWGNTVGKLPKDMEQISSEEQMEWCGENLRVLSGETVQREKVLHINQKPLYLKSTMSPIRMGEKITGFVGINMDITAQKEKELELRRALANLQENDALLEAIFNTVPLDMWVSDTNNVCIKQNPVSRQLWGDQIGLSIEDSHVSAALLEQWRKNNQRVLAGEIVRDPQVVETETSARYVDCNLAPIRIDEKVTGFVGVNIDMTDRILAERKITMALERISVLRKIDQTILTGTDINVIAKTIVNEARNLLQADAVEILSCDGMAFNLRVLASQGIIRPTAIKNISVYDDISRRAVLGEKQIFTSRFDEHLQDYPQCQALASEGINTYIAIPIIAKNVVRGVLEIFQHTHLEPNSEWWEYANLFANQTGIAIDNLLLFEGIQRSNAELSQAYDLTLEGWSRALELRDQETEGHTQRVTSLSVQLAEAMGIPRHMLTHIRRGALLHDIGKMGIPDQLLRKKEPLTEADWEIIRKHPVTAYELLKPIPFLSQALDIPYCHHEHWDGGGYPRGLKGEEIPLAARIFTVVDVWDALTSNRPYHQAETPEKALEYIQQNSGKLFDPSVVKNFEKLIQRS